MLSPFEKARPAHSGQFGLINAAAYAFDSRGPGAKVLLSCVFPLSTPESTAVVPLMATTYLVQYQSSCFLPRVVPLKYNTQSQVLNSSIAPFFKVQL